MLKSKSISVSIIMSVYNGNRYLKNSIESVLQQSYSDFELLLIDDGSTDDSYSIMKFYADKDKRIKVFHKENSGLTKSLNYGIKKAVGKYIARIDCDDIWLPNKLEKQIFFMKQNPQIYLCGCAYEEINENGEKCGRQRLPFVEGYENIKKALLKFNPFFHSSIIIKKEALNIVGFYDETIRYAQDYELWVRICSRYEADNLNDILALRRYTKEMISSKYEKEQRKCALLAKKEAALVFHISGVKSLHLLKDYLVIVMPVSFLSFLRRSKNSKVMKYLKKIYMGFMEKKKKP